MADAIQFLPIPDHVSELRAFIDQAREELLKATGISQTLDVAFQRRMNDLSCYGIHIVRDGKRVDPNDFYIAPEVK